MSKPPKFHSLATKFSVFTATLVLWITAAQVLFHTSQEYYSVQEHVYLSILLLIFAVLLARFTSRVFVRPLVVLKRGMASVVQGRLEPVRISPTHDEIEILGDSFNRMIAALAESRREVREHQEQLERKIRERTQALEKATRRAEAASRAKSEFLANMSHELRTPMNGILGMIDIVLDSPLTDAQREELATAKDCSFSLLGLLNAILDLSKIEAGKLELESIRFPIRPLLDDCLKSVLPRTRQKRLDLLSELSPDVPDYLLGDPLRLRQILINLLGNAVKFTDRGSVKLSLTSRRLPDQQRAELHFAIADTGVGIPKQKVYAIFDEFTQVDGSTTRKYGGTGLGLSITRKLVELHGGRIHVESEPGRGSVFHVLLDLPVAGPVPAEAAPNTAETVAHPHQPARILIAEDNPVNQKVAAVLLGKRGYQTTVVNHGREAIDALEHAEFDLVLMDLQMPVLDGIEATKLIRQDARWHDLPIIALTAHAMQGDRERCLAAGMNEYVPKPVQPPVLLATVRKCLAGSLAGETKSLRA